MLEPNLLLRYKNIVPYLLGICGVIYIKELAVIPEQILVIHVMCKVPTSRNECWVRLHKTVSSTVVRACFILLHAGGLQNSTVNQTLLLHEQRRGGVLGGKDKKKQRTPLYA